MRRNELVFKHRTVLIKEELFTCIHVCLHVIQHKWIKHINNDFPCISFLQNCRHSNDFFNEAKRRQKILFLILIVSTNIVNAFKIWALPVFGWFNVCIIYIFSYSSDSGTVLCDSTEEELKNEKEVFTALCTAVEGIYLLYHSTNFGIGKCEGMGGEGGDEYRLIQSRKLRKRRDWQYGY